jgi:hypothetical protein
MTAFYSLRFETPPAWRARFPYLYPPGMGWPGCNPRHWVLFSSPSTTRKATVEVSDPASTRVSNNITYLTFINSMWLRYFNPSCVRAWVWACACVCVCVCKVVPRKFWRWRIELGISGFLDFAHHPVFQRTRRFENWICYRAVIGLTLSSEVNRAGVSNPLIRGQKQIQLPKRRVL